MIRNGRHAGERGSALLIVLVFAAIVAIMLYRELPVAAFEAQRQKEELLMDRGNEYKRAIKLYVRKVQTFPPSIDALENTNHMRFLRARYVDPYTGKDDWRLLHAGPGGLITDSKIKPAAGANGVAASNGSSPLGAPSSVSNPFANSFNGGNPTGQQAVGNGFPQRPPAISATNSANTGGAGSDMPPGMPQDVPADVDPQALAAAQALAAQSPNQSPNGGVFPVAPGRFRGTNPTGNSYAPGQFGGAAPVVAGPQDPQSAMQSFLNTQNPQPTVQAATPNAGAPATTSAFGSNSGANGSGNGQMGSNTGGNTGGNMGGGIAGVASKSQGHTIKILNDQTDRSLWEFVYDMQKEATANAQGLGNSTNGGANGAAQNGTQSSTGSSFGSSTFGQNSNIGNVLTNSPSQNTPAQTPNQ